MLILNRLLCLFRGHLLVRRAVDPTMKMTSKTLIVCIECGKELPDVHLRDIP